jgi:uncharacterized protein
VIYLDSCALVKLLLPEQETQALRSFLRTRAAEGHASSALVETEVGRVLVRHGADQDLLESADDLLSRILRIRITEPVLRAAGRLPLPRLRSLDAIHLASAEFLEQALTAFVSYDKRLLAAAAERGLPVQSPGV